MINLIIIFTCWNYSRPFYWMECYVFKLKNIKFESNLKLHCQGHGTPPAQKRGSSKHHHQWSLRQWRRLWRKWWWKLRHFSYTSLRISLNTVDNKRISINKHKYAANSFIFVCPCFLNGFPTWGTGLSNCICYPTSFNACYLF